MPNGVRRIAFAFVFLAAVGVKAGAAGSSCADCHEKVAAPGYVGHNFNDWKGSAHAKAGIGCEACHGGDASAPEKAKAHQGVIRSTEKDSPVFFTKVPETCGACHKDELAAFKASVHYKELQNTGRGPNCVTCHGSMANHVLAPREMEMTCTLCHRRPTNAYAARLGIEESGLAVSRLQKAAQAPGVTDEQKREAEDLAKQQKGAASDWHSFNTEKVAAETKEIRLKADTALANLGVKKPEPKKAKKAGKR